VTIHITVSSSKWPHGLIGTERASGLFLRLALAEFLSQELPNSNLAPDRSITVAGEGFSTDINATSCGLDVCHK